MKKGRFITFEGGEGAGKSTQSVLLAEALAADGLDVIRTREPGGTEGAEQIRTLLVEGKANRWDAMTELLLHFAARRDHVEKIIKPALEKGTWVICDRFTDSTLAYQGYGHGLGVKPVTKLAKLVLGKFAPDMTFILDIPPEAGIGRTAERTHKENRYEQMERRFHESVRAGFRAIALDNPKRCHLIDATQAVEVVFARIEEFVGVWR